jgi:hypothetical protein
MEVGVDVNQRHGAHFLERQSSIPSAVSMSVSDGPWDTKL